jgi:hypothetical protein
MPLEAPVMRAVGISEGYPETQTRFGQDALGMPLKLAGQNGFGLTAKDQTRFGGDESRGQRHRRQTWFGIWGWVPCDSPNWEGPLPPLAPSPAPRERGRSEGGYRDNRLGRQTMFMYRPPRFSSSSICRRRFLRVDPSFARLIQDR